ncbi:MAG: hypothetical protein NTZ64_04125, partial [Polaromonas sp.]|nr:hypothetical protein [Polaromonas sp.]
MKKTSAILALAACACTFAAAETVEGVLEKSAPYSALFSASPESGDLIGYPFKNQSVVGKAILANCLPGMRCKIGKAATRNMDNTDALKFADHPSGWLEITQAKDVGMEAVVFGYEKKLKTRYGVVSVREEGNLLLFKGKPVAPAIEGNSSLAIVANYEIGQSDVLLLQNTGGTACPALFRFITVSAAGLRTTPEFGSCSDIIYPTWDAKTATITITTNGFRGPFEPEADKQKAYMTKTVFRFANGQVTENGKPLK